MGRPKKYANVAERVAAYRERTARVDLNIDRATFETLSELATRLDSDVSTVCRNLLKFALTNRNWKNSGLTYE